MATTATRVLRDDNDYYVVQYTHISDEAIEDAVTKLDASAVFAGSKYFVEEIWWSVTGLQVSMLWDAATDVLFMAFGTNNQSHGGHIDLSSIGGVSPSNDLDYTGDINFTTKNPDTGDTYSIILKCRKIK